MRRPLLFAFLLATPAAAQQRAAGRAPACAPDNGGLTLPAGFCATVFADSLTGPRHIVVAPNGDVLVNARAPRQSGAESGTAPVGGLYVLRDADGDGRAERVRRVGDAAGTGIALANGHLYATRRDQIVRWRYAPGAMTLGRAQVIVRDLPMGGHAAHNFVVQGNTLYLNIGSRTNSCQLQDRQLESKGDDPCTELETRAGIWTFDANRAGQTPASGKRFATGIRNGVALAWNAADRALWVAQHGRDQLTQNWPKLFDARYSAENPGEELFRVAQGDDFGWPYCYWSVDERKKVLAPEYGGDGKEVGRCAGRKNPVYVFPGHWAPNGLLFYGGRQFPAEYRNGAFVVFHGSWNRAPLPQAGFQVAFVPLNGGAAAGTHRTFASGFAGEGGTPGPDGRIRRPTGIAEAPDGSIYVSDDMTGRIWKIRYVGR